MKILLILISLFIITLDAHAGLSAFFQTQKANEMCEAAAMQQGGRSYRFLRAIYEVGNEVAYLYKKRNVFQIKLINKINHSQRELSFDQAVYDIQSNANSLFVLNKYSVIEYDINSLSFLNQYTIHQGMTSKYIRPYQFVMNNNLFYVAYGELGVKIFDTQSNTVIDTYKPNVANINGHRSLISGVQVMGDDLIIALDNVTLGPGSSERAFEGLAIKNLKTNKEKILKINQRMEAYHLPYLFKDSGKLYVNNLELYFTQTTRNLWRRRGALKPERRHYRFDPGYLVGRALIKDNQLYGCFRLRDDFHTLVSGAHSL